MKYRRFGKTELQMPVISCGGMRYQHSWNAQDAPTAESQQNVEACIHRALDLGINHIETARGYGTSEAQLGKVLSRLPRDEIIVQTKICPTPAKDAFIESFDDSMARLKLDHVDLLGIHGINNDELLGYTEDCIEAAQQWKRQGRVRHIGFSTHGLAPVIMKAIETDAFDYINLHYYYIYQNNWPAVQAAAQRDMGVFIISPSDKGGLLYKPSQKLTELCAPLHPLVFNALFCYSHPEIHTISCGVAQPSDFDILLEAAEKSDEAAALAKPIAERLDAVLRDTWGEEWLDTWDQGLPEWDAVPDQINIHEIMRLRNIMKAFDMVEFAKMRYNLLNDGGHWHPGRKAEKLAEVDLTDCLKDAKYREKIPAAIAEMHALLEGEDVKRLQTD